jgi:hypothetical protein
MGCLQPFPHWGRPDSMPLGNQFLGQASCAFACPTQWRLGIASALRFNQALQRRPDARSGCLHALTARTPSALAPGRRSVVRVQSPDSPANRARGQPRRRTHDRDSAAAQRHRFHGGPASPSTLRQLAGKSQVFTLNPLNNTLIHPRANCAFLPPVESTPVSSGYLRAAPKPDVLPASRPAVCTESRSERQPVGLNTNCQGSRVASMLACRHVSLLAVRLSSLKDDRPAGQSVVWLTGHLSRGKPPGRAPLFRSALNVVRPAHISGAASAGGSSTGINATALAWAIMYSA